MLKGKSRKIPNKNYQYLNHYLNVVCCCFVYGVALRIGMLTFRSPKKAPFPQENANQKGVMGRSA